ncbi:MAG: transglycosylase SLT domain-containing protein [Polyangiaceae bacterium]|nr:transglycosylase SLT domain-containing protein [Polyangiaceae bacterium]
MSVLHKIPPLVSALAFGYGVGMSAPESTITSMNAAVVAYQGKVPDRTIVAAAASPSSAPMRTQYGGGESQELALMRRAAESDREGSSCDLNRPSYSKSPRFESRPDGFADDADELDGPGVDALSRLQMPDLKVSISRRTLKYVRFFAKTDRGRGMFETWLRRSGRYQDLIQSELRKRHLPEDLIWVSMIESGFDARAKSPAGAVGLWQFMPATGKVYGLDQNKYIDQRKNPRLATQAAAHHLRDLFLRFQNWDLALAAYNMGYEQLLDRIDRYGTTDFNELVRQDALPSETATYVPKIAAAAIVANNLDRFGFDNVEMMRPADTAEVAVPPGTPLKLIAKAAGVSTSVIRNLNPDVLSEKMPPGRGDFLVLIPSDSLSRARVTLPALIDNEPIESDATVLDPVDLLGGRAFRPRNSDGDESLLSLLPKPKRRHSMRDDLESLSDGDDDPSDSPRARKGRETVMYRVGPGETLLGIAKQFAVDVEDVARENHIDVGDALKVGQLIRLNVSKEAVNKAASEKAAAGASDSSDGEKLRTRDRKGEPKEKSDEHSKGDSSTKSTHHPKATRHEKLERTSGDDADTQSQKRVGEKKKTRAKKH